MQSQKRQCRAAFECEQARAALAKREVVLADGQLRIYEFYQTMDAVEFRTERRACIDIARALSAELEDEQDTVTALAEAAELDRRKADIVTIDMLRRHIPFRVGSRQKSSVARSREGGMRGKGGRQSFRPEPKSLKTEGAR
jgi:hypothetical protein